MGKRLRAKLTYSNVIASIALFIALGGAAVAAGLPRNSVGPNQIKKGAVTAAKLRKGAVTAGKLAPKSVVAGKLGPNSVTPGNLGKGVVGSSQLAENGILAKNIKNGVITTNKLNNGAVTAQKLGAGAVETKNLADGSVTLSKLAENVSPLLGTLRSGQTLRGSFDLGAEASVAHAGQSFQFPLLNAPAAPETNVLLAGASTTACPGLAGGNAQTPEAAAGQLCVYVTKQEGKAPSLSFDPGSVTRLGFGLLAKFNEPFVDNYVQGLWAVTAP